MERKKVLLIVSVVISKYKLPLNDGSLITRAIICYFTGGREETGDGSGSDHVKKRGN